MVKININFSNKTFYLLVSILGLLAITAVVFAYGGSTPAVMGHSSEEIRNCATYDNPTAGYMRVDISEFCLDEDGCMFSIHRRSSGDFSYGLPAEFFYQFEGTNKWGMSQASRSGTNGDGIDTKLMGSSLLGNCAMWDDIQTEENTPTEVVLESISSAECFLRICD
jgi:hypothetical protein